MRFPPGRTFVLLAAGSLALTTVISTPSADASSKLAAVPYSIRLEDQLLATLRYLPLTFVASSTSSASTAPTTTTTSTSTTTTTTPTSGTTTTTAPSSPATTTTTTTTTVPVATTEALTVQNGSFKWRFALPNVLERQWSVGTDNVILEGALMNFQNDHDLQATGSMNGPTWRALVQAARDDQVSHQNYNYVLVNQNQPEHLKLYQNGRVTFTSLVNTGVSDAPTQAGTYPVYLRFRVTTMSGKLPDGKPYDDPGIPWVSYFHGGDALHGFIRASYGFPQSLGCVEMPFADAKVLWPETPIGTLVTVE